MRNLVVGASGGIGRAVVAYLQDLGEEVVTASRREDNLDICVDADVRAWVSNLTGEFDRILIATGALTLDGIGPEKTIAALDPNVMAAQYATNAIGPAILIKHLQDFLPKDRHSVMAVLSARVGSISDNRLGGWISYRAAKAGLNQIVHSAAIEINRKRKQAIIVSYHPGTVRTELTRKYVGSHPATDPIEAAAHMISVLDGLSQDQSGGFFDWKGALVPW
ncbi:MAG: SDR family NAD(P)-dependent oxidoreductase [Pseudomonadota bacterium]